MKIHSRSEWVTSTSPLTGPGSKGDGFWVIHHPGNNGSNPPSTLADQRKYLQDHQSYSLRVRGYSLYYNFFIFPNGRVWECRGFDINNAANVGSKWQKLWGTKANFNDRSKSIHLVVSGQSPATKDQQNSCNELIAMRPDWPVIPHQEVEWTICPGEGNIALLEENKIGQQPVGPVDPPPTLPVDTDIAWYIVKGDNPWSVSEVVYGHGKHNDKLIHSDFNTYSTNGKPVHTPTPGIKGVKANVKEGGSAYSTLRDMGFNPSESLATFYEWNGFDPDGRGRTLHPGDLVYMPKP